ncbi:hypothetical protein [Piscinibacter sakaiensis]|uniref:hypothetical protein n=1 Tax=Piscinibacter sakaiensis TaxID=1547922 RepID=UPI003AAA8D34
MTTVAGMLAACSSPMPPHQPLPSAPPARDADTARPAAMPAALPPPAAARNWSEYRQQAAQRLVAASPGGSYLGTVPETLLAIPVLEIELNADGSVRRIDVLRHPKQARDTTELAIAAVHRAAPFGSVSKLPRPWKFAETFLFNDARQFKPRSLD